MLDIKFVREHPDAVKADLEKRKASDLIPKVDEVIEKDTRWRELKQHSDTLRADRNRLSEQINLTKKQGGEIGPLLQQVRELPEQIRRVDAEREELAAEIQGLLMRIPNVTHESVPVGSTSDGNLVIKEFGRKRELTFTPKTHTQLVEDLGLVDLERAAKIAGSRNYFLLGDLALLEHALQSYALAFLAARDYTIVEPPHFMQKEFYKGVTDLHDFEDVLYKLEGEDAFLIATSEHPLVAQFAQETFESASLPIKLAGISPCYRKETGTHGKEEKGIWRVHNFNKVEQVVISNPSESWDLLEELIWNAVAFFESLELHFRQVLICTGDLGTVAAKKYDLEAWIPSVNEYKEIVSASNCTSYQAVRLGIRCRDQGANTWVHTLNSTCVATTRALAAIVEQYQEEDGSISIPKALRPYLGGRTKISASKRFPSI